MISRMDVPRGTPYIVPGKSSGSWTAQSSSCRSGENSCAGSPAAIHPIGTTVSGGRVLLTCSTLLIRSSLRVPARVPANIETPVAGRQRLQLGLFGATGPPIIVAVTTMAVESGQLSGQGQSIVVAAGMLTVPALPMLALTLHRPEPVGAGSR